MLTFRPTNANRNCSQEKKQKTLLQYQLWQQQEQLLGSIRPGSSCGGSIPAAFGAEQTQTCTTPPGSESCHRWGQQISVRGHGKGSPKDSRGNVGTMASALLNFLCGKERGEGWGAWCSGDSWGHREEGEGTGELEWELASWCWWVRKADVGVTQHLF